MISLEDITPSLTDFIECDDFWQKILVIETAEYIPKLLQRFSTAEIYFVNTVANLDIHWGTIDPIQLVDPKYRIKLRIRSFGQMGVKVIDAPKMFGELIGGMEKGDIVKFDKTKEYFKGLLVLKVKNAIANRIIADKKSRRI